MWTMQMRALVLDSFREAIEKKLFWIFAGITVFIAMVMACIGMSDKGVSLMFGWKVIETELFDPSTAQGHALIGAILTKGIGDFYIQFIGIIIALVATCGVIPTLMQRGAIDVVLSKPISRRTLFLGKYFGSMVFVLLQATLFVVLTLLVAGLRWHYWSWAYLLCIPLIVILYSYIYAFTALFGVMTRNAMAAFLLSLLAWFGMFLPQLAYETLDGAGAIGLEIDAKWVQVAKFAKLVVPKTTDITYIAGNLIGASTVTPTDEGDGGAQGSTTQVAGDTEATPKSGSMMNINMREAAESEQRVSDVNPYTSIGSSLLFEAIVVYIALLKFSRRDF